MKPGRKPCFNASDSMAMLTMPMSRHRDSDSRKPSENVDTVPGACMFDGCSWLGWPPAECVSDAAHAQIFHLEVFVDAVLRALAAQSRLLDAAERRDLVRDDAGVDADNSVLER